MLAVWGGSCISIATFEPTYNVIISLDETHIQFARQKTAFSNAAIAAMFLCTSNAIMKHVDLAKMEKMEG